MIRATNYTTFLLILIVLVLIVGVGVAAYYVLDLEWFKNPIVIYKEEKPTQEILPTETILKYDMTKRTYNMLLLTEEFRTIIYSDGTVGITMLENTKYRNIGKYSELVNKEEIIEVINVVRAYEVETSTVGELTKHMLLLDIKGNLYKLNVQKLVDNGKYEFEKIEGLSNIIDVQQITNDGLMENVMGSNVIAIDNRNNELLLTNYLLEGNLNLD